MCNAEDLRNIKQRIQKNELDGLRMEIREKLLIVANWMQSNPDANIMTEFDVDVYEKLCDQRDIMKHICDQIGIPIFSRLKLKECGICTAQDILKVRDRIQNQELDNLHEEACEKLLVVSEWMQSHPDANMIQDFDWEVCDKLYKVQR